MPFSKEQEDQFAETSKRGGTVDTTNMNDVDKKRADQIVNENRNK